jgi:hypothetical protein
MLPQLLGHEEDQPFWEDGNMVVDQGVPHIRNLIFSQTRHLHREMLKIQQFPVLHVPCRVYLIPFQVLLILSNSFSKNTNLMRLRLVLEPDSPQNAGTVLDKRNGDAQPEETYLLEGGGLHYIEGLLAKRETLSVKLHQVDHLQDVFHLHI